MNTYFLMHDPRIFKYTREYYDEREKEGIDLLLDWCLEHIGAYNLEVIIVCWKNSSYYATLDPIVKGLLECVNIDGTNVYLFPSFMFPFNIDESLLTTYYLTQHERLANSFIHNEPLEIDIGNIAIRVKTLLELDYPFYPTRKNGA